MPSDPSNGDRMYRRLDVAPEASPSRSAAPTAASPTASIPTPTPKTPTPPSGSGRSPRPTRFSATRPAVPATTATADHRQPAISRPPAPPRTPTAFAVTPIHAPGQPGEPAHVYRAGIVPVRLGSPDSRTGPRRLPLHPARRRTQSQQRHTSSLSSSTPFLEPGGGGDGLARHRPRCLRHLRGRPTVRAAPPDPAASTNAKAWSTLIAPPAAPASTAVAT